jgi:three-Cys-motif partner protein
METNSKNTLYEHSAAKVRLLREYMSAYLGILANTDWIKEIRLYDLFSGPGIYEDGGEGSPIVFLQEIKRAHQYVSGPRNKETNFVCLFNDKEGKRITKLKENIATKELDISSYGGITYRTDDYKVVLKDVKSGISRFNNERGFVFIDPYGYSEISLNDIADLTSSGKCEVLLFMPTHHMYRFKDNGTPECLVKFLEDLDIYNKIRGVKGLEFIERVKDGFQSKLGDVVFVDSFVIKRDANQFFCLFFFTSNMLGFIKMLEAKWKVDQEEGRGWQSSSEYNLFNQTANTANTDKLRKFLLAYLKEGPKSSGELFEFVVRHRFLPKHGTEILKSIQDSLEVTDTTGNKARKGAFYQTYENFKKYPNKITVKLK